MRVLGLAVLEGARLGPWRLPARNLGAGAGLILPEADAFSTAPVRLHEASAGPDGLGNPDHPFRAPFDVLVRRGPARDRDPHRGMSLPYRAPTPARAIGLNLGNNALGLLRGTKRDKNLVENHIIQNQESGGFEALSEPLRLPAVALDHFA